MKEESKEDKRPALNPGRRRESPLRKLLLYVVPVLVTMAIAIFVLPANRFACEGIGEITTSEILEKHGRHYLPPSVTFVFKYSVGDAVYVGADFYQPASKRQYSWTDADRQRAAAWMREYPVGRAIKVKHHCYFPSIGFAEVGTGESWTAQARTSLVGRALAIWFVIGFILFARKVGMDQSKKTKGTK